MEGAQIRLSPFLLFVARNSEEESDISSSIIEITDHLITFVVPEDTTDVEFIKVTQLQSFECFFGTSDMHRFAVLD